MASQPIRATQAARATQATRATQAARAPTGLRRRLPALIARVRKDRALYAMLALPVLFFLIFHYQPMYGVLIAFKEFKISKGILGSPWADDLGFYHFVRFFSSNAAFRLINNTFQLSFWSLVWGFPAPIILALLLHECRLPRFKKTVQTVTYLPHFISIVAIVGILTLLLAPRDGSINHMLALIGLERIYFMADTRWFRPVYVISGIWQDVGFGAIIYLAALSRANPELYEAATVDGAGRLRRIWHVSVPALAAVAIILLILRTGSILSVGFEKVFLMQNDLNIRVSDVIQTYVYRVGLRGREYSFGGAVGLFQSVVGLILLIIVNKVCSKVSGTSLW